MLHEIIIPDRAGKLAFIGIDPGIRGGAGISAIDSDGKWIFSHRVTRSHQESTIQMFARVRDVAKELILRTNPVVVVAREDHVFPGSFERIARNFLRRQNGVIDVMAYDLGYTGLNYMAFPVNTWKAIIGVSGTFGKEHQGMEAGVRATLGSTSKKNTEAAYLAAMNKHLGVDHEDVDKADSHGIALAALTVYRVKNLLVDFFSLAGNSQKSLWDKDRCDSTISKVWRNHPEVFADKEKLGLCLKTFAA